MTVKPYNGAQSGRNSEPTPAVEIAAEQRNAQIKRRDALITEARLERRRRKKTGKPSLATLRVADLTRLFYARYRGSVLPDDDDGRHSAWLMINHLAMLSSPDLRVDDWLARCAPWLDDDDAMIARALAKPQRWCADTLGRELNLTDAECKRVKAWTIGPVDCTKPQRAARRRTKNRLAKQAKRRAAGAKSRADFLAQSVARSKLGGGRYQPSNVVPAADGTGAGTAYSRCICWGRTCATARSAVGHAQATGGASAFGVVSPLRVPFFFCLVPRCW